MPKNHFRSRPATVAIKYAYYTRAEYAQLNADTLTMEEIENKLMLSGWISLPIELLYLEMERSLARNYPSSSTGLEVVFPSMAARLDAFRIMSPALPTYWRFESQLSAESLPASFWERLSVNPGTTAVDARG